MRRLTLFALIALVPLLSAARWQDAVPQPTTGYSADFTLQLDGFGDELNDVSGRLYADPPRAERREVNVQGMDVVNIIRFDTGKMYSRSAAVPMTMEMDIGEAYDPRAADFARLDVERLERTTVDGMAADRYRISGADTEGNSFDGEMFLEANTNIVLRLDSAVAQGSQQGRVLMQVRNIRVGPQDPGLFEAEGGGTLNLNQMMQGLNDSGMLENMQEMMQGLMGGGQQ